MWCTRQERIFNVYILQNKSNPEVWYLLIELLDVVYIEFQPRVEVLYRGYLALYLLILIVSVKIFQKKQIRISCSPKHVCHKRLISN